MLTVLLALLLFLVGEAYAVLWVAQQIGLLGSIGLTLVTGVLGLLVVRDQGLRTIRKADADVRAGRMPVESVIHGAGLLVAGLCLFLPGFLTDTLGAALLLPPVRLSLGRAVLRRIKSQMEDLQKAAEQNQATGVYDLETEMWRDTTPTPERGQLRDDLDHASQPARPADEPKDTK